MNKKQSQTLQAAMHTLDLLGYKSAAKTVSRVIDTEIRNSAEHEAAFNHAIDMRIDIRQAFAYWYAKSGRNDLEQAYREYPTRMVASNG